MSANTKLMERHPGVRRLRAAAQCQGSTARSFRAMREGRGVCKNPAWWHFTPLARKTFGFTTQERDFCWSHLIHAGVYGDMDEEARTERWLAREERKAEQS